MKDKLSNPLEFDTAPLTEEERIVVEQAKSEFTKKETIKWEKISKISEQKII